MSSVVTDVSEKSKARFPDRLIQTDWKLTLEFKYPRKVYHPIEKKVECPPCPSPDIPKLSDSG